MKPERRAALKEAGGKHTRADIAIIHDLQLGRCIWCDVEFSPDQPSTRDHILPLVYGGNYCALNIVLACRSCNSRRCHNPFRTFCRLLSPKQNQRILDHLERRISAIDPKTVSPEDFNTFDVGLRLHVKSDWHYKTLIRQKQFEANLRRNKLLPRGVEGILRELLRRERVRVRAS